MGFQPGLIAETVGIPRGTVNEIIRATTWHILAQDETFKDLRLRARRVIEAGATTLAQQAMHRLEAKMQKASIMELTAIYQALTGGTKDGKWNDT